MVERRLAPVDAQLTLAALAALPGPGAGAGAEALIELGGSVTGYAASTSWSAIGCARRLSPGAAPAVVEPLRVRLVVGVSG